MSPEALQFAGFQTAVAHDGLAALSQWRSFAPHAAVLDVGLPEIDGYELAKQLRAAHGAAPTLIAATGYGQRKDRLRAADAGFDCHFVKPVSVRDLIKVLDLRVVSPTIHAHVARCSAAYGKPACALFCCRTARNPCSYWRIYLSLKFY